MGYDPTKRIIYCANQHAKQKEEEAKKEVEKKEQYYAALGQEPPKERSYEEVRYVDTDKYGTIDNGTATFWYIVVMLVGTIFKDRLFIWILATIIWWRHINRKAIRQKEWDKMQAEKKNGGNK